MKKKQSFTLIEMVIVIGVLGFALPVMFAIMFIIIQQQGRIYSLQIVKKEGDIAYNSMKSTIRQYGKQVVNPTIDMSPYPTYNPCPVLPNDTPTPAAYLFFLDKANHDFSYQLDGTKIASKSAASNITSDYYLTTDNVRVTNLQFSCYRTAQFAPPVVWMTFTVTKSGTDANPPSLDYTSRFQLRNY